MILFAISYLAFFQIALLHSISSNEYYPLLKNIRDSRIPNAPLMIISKTDMASFSQITSNHSSQDLKKIENLPLYDLVELYHIAQGVDVTVQALNKGSTSTIKSKRILSLPTQSTQFLSSITKTYFKGDCKKASTFLENYRNHFLSQAEKKDDQLNNDEIDRPSFSTLLLKPASFLTSKTLDITAIQNRIDFWENKLTEAVQQDILTHSDVNNKDLLASIAHLRWKIGFFKDLQRSLQPAEPASSYFGTIWNIVSWK